MPHPSGLCTCTTISWRTLGYRTTCSTVPATSRSSSCPATSFVMCPSTCRPPSTSCTSRWEGVGRKGHPKSRDLQWGKNPGPHGHSGKAMGPWAHDEGTAFTAEKQTKAWTPSCQPHTWSAPGLGPLPVTSLDTSSYLLPRCCPCPLAIPHVPLPTVPLPRATSWRRSHQVPSVS